MDIQLRYKKLFDEFETWYSDVLLYNFKLKFLFITLLIINLFSTLICVNIYHGISPIVEKLEIVIETDRDEKEFDLNIVTMHDGKLDTVHNLAGYLASKYIIERESLNPEFGSIKDLILSKEDFVKRNSNEEVWDGFKKIHMDIRNQDSLLHAAMLKINRKVNILSKVVKKRESIFVTLYRKLVPSFEMPNEFSYIVEVQDGNLSKRKFIVDVKFTFDVIVSDTVNIIFQVTGYSKQKKD